MRMKTEKIVALLDLVAAGGVALAAWVTVVDHVVRAQSAAGWAHWLELVS